MQGLTFVAPFLGILGLIIAYVIYLYVKKQPNGTPLMQELEGMIHSGAMAFLKREYSVLIFFITAVFVLLGLFLGEWKTPIAFVTGAFCSMLAKRFLLFRFGHGPRRRQSWPRGTGILVLVLRG
jgi:K(+)-stimulated pyrophosphate-energized sodium pump